MCPELGQQLTEEGEKKKKKSAMERHPSPTSKAAHLAAFMALPVHAAPQFLSSLCGALWLVQQCFSVSNPPSSSSHHYHHWVSTCPAAAACLHACRPTDRGRGLGQRPAEVSIEAHYAQRRNTPRGEEEEVRGFVFFFFFKPHTHTYTQRGTKIFKHKLPHKDG